MYIGVEIGGTKQQVALVNDNGEIQSCLSEKVVLKEGAKDILAWLKVHIKELTDVCSEVRGIGVGFGGIVETKEKRLTMSVQVKGWENFPMESWMEEQFGKKTIVVNDTVAGGYAELKYGSGKRKKSFFYTNIGTGIGGVTFLNERPMDGIGYGCSYFGHTYVPVNGGYGKLENYCSGVAIEKRMRKPGYVPNTSKLYEMCVGKTEDLTCLMLAEAALAKDTFAKEVIEDWAKVYSVAMSNYITLFSPELITLGGGVSNMGDLILEPIRKYTDTLVFESAKDRYEIVKCQFGDEAVVVGAALFARDGFDPIV